MRVSALRRGTLRLALALAALALPVAWQPLAAQALRGEKVELPREVAAELIEFINRRATTRMTGASRIASGGEVMGDVAVLGGPVTIAGRIHGRLLVVNGDVHLEPDAAIAGDLTVVGGRVTGLEGVPVEGSVVIYRAPLRFRTEGERLVLAPIEHEPESALATGREFGIVRADLTLATRRGYNRAEGLPIAAGARLEGRTAYPLAVEALGIYRTQGGVGFERDRLGYLLEAEQSLDQRRSLRLGARLRSEVEPIESVGFSDRENALATFLLHRDYRDYYERTGWSTFLRWTPPGRAYEGRLEFLSEQNAVTAVGEPWTLVHRGRPWRPQPVVAEGTLRSLALDLRFDTRNEGADPATGWLIHAALEQGLGGELAYPRPVVDTPLLLPVSGPDPRRLPPAGPQSASTDFLATTLDLRRYARLSPSSRLAMRVLATGSLDGRALPAQRQHALGGEGSLPGYAPFHFDCGARALAREYDGGSFFPYYGCDRLALFQLEFQNEFPLIRGWGRKLGRDIDLGERAGWVVFFDAGRAWIERKAREGRWGGQNDFAADAGLGVRIGHLGLYWAVPLSGHDRNINFFVRLGPRF
jgi:hypothetical protein